MEKRAADCGLIYDALAKQLALLEDILTSAAQRGDMDADSLNVLYAAQALALQLAAEAK